MTTRKSVFCFGASAIALFGILRWRARKQARKVADDTEKLIKDGPLVNFGREIVHQRLLKQARKRASKWISYKVAGADQLVSQVGGVSIHKRPLLTLKPDYVLKPLQLDHRGIRELFFYEGLNAASHTSGTKMYLDFVSSQRTVLKSSWIDVAAFSIAFLFQDWYVLECEKRILNAWTVLEDEAKFLRRLYRFVPPYFGMTRYDASSSLGNLSNEGRNPETSYGIKLDCYLLLQDITVNFEKPCVIDLKMGSRTYEPDAPESKKKREQEKYPQQSTYGFRIVGKRIYQPSHKNAGKDGFVFYSKELGRSLNSYEGLKDAFVLFLGLNNVDESLLSARLKIVTSILLQLRSLQHWFQDNSKFCFCASSILVAYEGNTDPSCNLDAVTVKMIDFGRVRRRKGGDPGYLKGLKTLTSILEEISDEWRKRTKTF